MDTIINIRKNLGIFKKGRERRKYIYWLSGFVLEQLRTKCTKTRTNFLPLCPATPSSILQYNLQGSQLINGVLANVIAKYLLAQRANFPMWRKFRFTLLDCCWRLHSSMYSSPLSVHIFGGSCILWIRHQWPTPFPSHSTKDGTYGLVSKQLVITGGSQLMSYTHKIGSETTRLVLYKLEPLTKLP